MRCFPHCCPEHRRRSYCGSSLHLKLQPEVGRIKATQHDEALVVYARFRPGHVNAMPIGSIISVEAIESSLQRNDPSKGEWIDCEPIRPAKGSQANAWTYEVNPSGRWYYPWSGAATIAMRTTEHVIEALVFRCINAKQLQLVSGTVSSSFRLISFRRGGAGDRSSASQLKKKLKATTRVASPTEVVAIKRVESSNARSSHFEPSSSRLPRVWPKVAVDRKRPQEQSFPVIQLPVRSLPLHTPAEESHIDEDNATNCMVPPPTGNPLEMLMRWLHELPASSVGSRSMLVWQEMVEAACEAQVTASREVPTVRAGLVPLLSALDVEMTKPSLMRPSPSSSHSAPMVSAAAGSPLDTMDAAMRVLLHEWLDVDSTRASSESVKRLVRNGLTPQWEDLSAAHGEWLNAATARAQQYVNANARASWSQLMATTSRLAQQSPTANPLQAGGEFGYRSFVAKYRELIKMQAKQRSSHLSPAYKRRRSSASTTKAVPAGLVNSAPVWTSRLEDVGVEMDSMSQHTLSLLTIVQFWKHLSCLRFDFSPASSPSTRAPQLSVASVFNSLVNDGSFTKLTLDGQYRWFNCLPSGEPNIGTTLMGYVVGDYVGHATSAGTIHLTTYLWPATTEASTATAYAWHWTLDASSLSSGSSSSVVSVVVESASVGRTPHARETMSMAEKLCCVGRWHHACEVRVEYRNRGSH